jgi:hypothetical protein
MKARTGYGLIVMMLVLAITAQADGKGQLQKYFSDAANKVKATENVSEKRAILEESFESMAGVLEMVQRSPSISQDDQAGLARLRATVQEKQDELAGVNGFDRVEDAQLNAFAQYVVQDIEQADKTITISVVTLLLIIILIVLIL